MIKLAYGIQIILLLLVLVSCNSVAEQNNTGNSLTNALDFDDAIRAYSSAQVSDPDNPIPYINTAKAYFEQGNLDIAIEVLEQAILRGDENIKAQAHYNMGNFYFMSQQMEGAIPAYREALIINPNDENARHNLDLAMFYSSTPTPFDDEMKTESEENQVDPTALPTNQPLDFDGPTPTPPPIELNDEENPEGGQTGENFGNKTEGTPSPRQEATFSVPEAKELLNPLKQSDSIYGKFSDKVATPEATTGGKQW